MLTRRLADPSIFAFCRYALPHFEAGPDAAQAPTPAAPVPAEDAVFLSRGAAAGGAGIGEAAGVVLRAGGEPVICFSQDGRSRAEVLSELRDLHSLGVRSLLCVTGDYPAGGRTAFDLDSVQLLMLLREAAAGGAGFPRDLSVGCVVSPFKDLEAEQVWQYEKLARKVEVGAGFIVAQAGFELRKHDELIRFCRSRGLDRPVIAQVLVPDPGTVARIRAGKIPGVTIPEALARLVEQEGDGEEGRGKRLLRAGRTVAALRGMGYRGVLLSGAVRPGDVGTVLEEAGRHAESWRECLEETWPDTRRFFYFQAGGGGELNSDLPAPRAPRRRPHPMYLLSWAIDYIAFGSWPPMFRLLYRVCRFCDARPFWRRALWLFEYAAKVPVYHCRMCGDCTLYSTGFLCHRVLCPKAMLNGPCGGSSEGRCEVDPEKRECYWIGVYKRLRDAGHPPGFIAPPIPPKDLSLEGGSSWISFCLGRDHRHVKSPLP